MKITLSGSPYSGKGDLCKQIPKILKIPYKSIGNLRREYALKQNMTITELNKLAEKESKWDKLADEYQVEWAKKQESFILEGRLSYHFIPKSIKVFLYVSPKEAAKRAMKSKRDSENPAKTVDEQIKKNELRCQSDNKRYEALYGIKDCYDFDNFDIVIDTTKLNQEQVLVKTLHEIRRYSILKNHSNLS